MQKIILRSIAAEPVLKIRSCSCAQFAIEQRKRRNFKDESIRTMQFFVVMSAEHVSGVAYFSKMLGISCVTRAIVSNVLNTLAPSASEARKQNNLMQNKSIM